MKAKFRGDEYEVLDIDDAVAEYNKQKAKGVSKTIYAVDKGFIVVDTALVELKYTMDVLKAQGMTEKEAVVCLEGIRKGLQARREGRIRPWSEIKKELGL